MAEFKVVKAEENGQEICCWSDLPQDILSIIFPHLFAKDCISFSSVCRSWRSYGVEFRQLPPPINLAPYLFSTQRSNQKCNFYYPTDNQFYHVDINIPELSNSYIHYSNFGWLLMSTYDGALFFFNPFTKVKINIPEVPRVNAFLTMYFSSAPTSEDCLVVGLSCSGWHDITIGVIRNRGQSWEFKNLKSKPQLLLSDCSPVFYKGKYYCLGAEGYVVELDINNNGEWSCTVSTKPLGTKPLDKKLSKLVHQSFMLEAQGKLFGVFIYGDERRVRVYKLNTKYGMVWELVENLGDKILYVSPGLCFGEQAVVEGTGNKIYFPKFYGKNGVYYSLETKKYHSIAGDYSSQTSYNLQEFNFCTWIKPTFNSQQYNKVREE